MDIFTPSVDSIKTLHILRVPNASPVAVSAQLQAQITRGWEALCAYRHISVNDTLLRVVAHDSQSVAVAPDIDYRSVVGARYCSALAGTPYQALSALAVTVTSDNQVVFFVRDSGDWPRSYEWVGGFVRARYTYDTVHDFMLARCAREIGTLRPRQIAVLGSYQFASIAEYMLVYRYDVRDTAVEVRQKYPTSHAVPLSDITVEFSSQKYFSLPLHHPTAQVLRELQNAGLLK